MKFSLLSREIRGDIQECHHYGSAVVADAKGNVLFSSGDPSFSTYLRSSSKLLQALAVLESGAFAEYKLSPAHLAVICGSHAGENIHVNAVRQILENAGLSFDHLRCPESLPLSNLADPRHSRNIHDTPKKQTHNCSGKHAGMLILCKHLGLDMRTYLDNDHPVQQRNLKIHAEMMGVPEDNVYVGLDGCGVPTFGAKLTDIAKSYACFADPVDQSKERCESVRMVVDAVKSFPEMVSGSNRYQARLIKMADGKLIMKGGAAGLMCGTILDKGLGFAVKSIDGSGTGYLGYVINLLKAFGVFTEEDVPALKQYISLDILNGHNDVAGHFVCEPVILPQK